MRIRGQSITCKSSSSYWNSSKFCHVKTWGFFEFLIDNYTFWMFTELLVGQSIQEWTKWILWKTGFKRFEGIADHIPSNILKVVFQKNVLSPLLNTLSLYVFQFFVLCLEGRNKLVNYLVIIIFDIYQWFIIESILQMLSRLKKVRCCF